MESTIGGTRRHIIDVARGQHRAGLDVHLAVAAERTPGFLTDLDELRAEGIGVTRIPMAREIRPSKDLAHARRLVRLLRELRPAVVHTHSSKAGALGRYASIRTGIGQRVHTPHTYSFLFNSMFSRPKRALFRRIETWLGARTERIISVSETEAQTIGDSGVVPRERIRVVPNGIDPAPWMEAEPFPRAELAVPAGVPLTMVAGLLNVAKGQDVALRALARPGLERLYLLLAGEGETEHELRELAAELGVTDRVRFLGWRSDLPRLLRACDLLWLPSRWEGMPYIALEAMAAGLPVVATRVDGARDLIDHGESGHLVPLDSPPALAEATVRLLASSPEQRAAMGAAGRERVLARFTSEQMVRGLLAVYEELV